MTVKTLQPDLSNTLCVSCRVGLCGLGGPGQRPPAALSGDLLVPVLPSLLLLLRAVLLLSRHLLLPTTPSVQRASVSSPFLVAQRRDSTSCPCCFLPAQCTRRGRWPRAARLLLRFLSIPTTSPVFLLWFLFPSLPHRTWSRRSPPCPPWRPT